MADENDKRSPSLAESLAATQAVEPREPVEPAEPAVISLAETAIASETFGASRGEGIAESASRDGAGKATGPASFAETLAPAGARRPPALPALVSDPGLLRTAIAGEGAPSGDWAPGDWAPGEGALGLARTITPDEAGGGGGHDEAITDDPELQRLALRPDGGDPRLKAMIRARLFRGRAAPVRIGRYTVLDRLGEGGMGVVYTAYDDRLERKVAIKVMRGDAEGDAHGRGRLIREAQAMARLSHPNIVTVHEVGEVEGQIFVAMEFIRGQSLDQWLRDPRPWREVVAVYREAGRGLIAAHDAGIIHRDFKPHNVLLAEDGAVKVLDFGLARSLTAALPAAPEEEPGAAPGPGEGALSLLDQRLTRTGAILGTPAYMAPEQHEGGEVTAQSDQFAFCVALYEGLYGALPFPANSLGELVAALLQGRVEEAPAGSKVPAWLRRVVLRGLEVAPERRYPTMAELLAALARDPVARRRRWLATAGFAAVIGGAGFGAASLQGAGAPTCSDGRAELAAIWGEGPRAAAAAALGETWERVAPALDTYAADWAAMHAEACESHRGGRHSDRLYDLRVACLDRRFAEFGALAGILGEADAGVAERAVEAAYRLSPVAACGDLEALNAAVAPPADPAAVAAVAAARGDLARARALELTGRLDAGLALAAPVIGRARDLAYAPLEAEALLQVGSLALEAGRAEEAAEHLRGAQGIALAAGHDGVALEALAKHIYLRAVDLGDAEGALGEAWLAEALEGRAAAGAAARALVANNLGVALDLAGRGDAAIAAYGRALAAEREAAAGSPLVGAILNNIAGIHLVEERAAAAIATYEEAVQALEGALGPGHPNVAYARMNLGEAYVKAGRLGAGQRAFEGALAVLEAAGGDHRTAAGFLRVKAGGTAVLARDLPRAEALLAAVLGESAGAGAEGVLRFEALTWGATAASLRGDHPAALAGHRQALALREAEGEGAGQSGLDPVLEAFALDAYGDSLRRAGELDAAAARHLEAIALREAKLPPGAPLQVLSLTKLVRVRLAQGRPEAAAEPLARAEAVVAELAPENLLRGEVERVAAELAIAGGARQAAVDRARRALEILGATRDPEDGELALTRFLLARALVVGEAETEAQVEAETHAAAAQRTLEALGDGWAPEAREIAAWRAARG